MGILLRKMGLDFVILEKDEVGSSFVNWPPETRFISPSFTGNSFGAPDLNAVSPETSPAFSLNTEHPTGKEYAEYLKLLASHYKLPVVTKAKIEKVTKKKNKYILTTERGKVDVHHLIWAAGEYQYPRQNSFPGSEHCIHNSQIKSWEDVDGDNICIIGGYESGMDSAVQLAKLGKSTHVIDSGDPLNDRRSDSSYSLSPFTKDRVEEYGDFISMTANTRIKEITHDGDSYILHTEEGEQLSSLTEPILANGFSSSLTLIEDLFEWKDDYPVLSEYDESTISPNLYLAGPQVFHSKALFCFIYKFRQRFPIIAESITKKLGLNKKKRVQTVIKDYKNKNFYLKDLSCCNDECSC